MGKRKIFLWCEDLYMEGMDILCSPGTKGRANIATEKAVEDTNRDSVVFISAGIPTKKPHYLPYRQGAAAYIGTQLISRGYECTDDQPSQKVHEKHVHKVTTRLVGEEDVYGAFEEALAFGPYVKKGDDVWLVTSDFHMLRVRIIWFLLYGTFPNYVASKSFHQPKSRPVREFASIIEAILFAGLYRIGGKRLLKPFSDLKNKLITH